MEAPLSEKSHAGYAFAVGWFAGMALNPLYAYPMLVFRNIPHSKISGMRTSCW
jgi:hypothetical protein